MGLQENIINIKNYSFKFQNTQEQVLKNLNFEIKSGEFLVICGASGSGKTTLLKSFKEEIAPVGISSGNLEFNINSKDISIVFQNPDTHLITSSILFDLAFSMESRGIESQTMKKLMAETVSFFGLEDILHKNSECISGGQKQIVALCSALMLRPKLLLLDEPISQLDPIAAREFLSTLKQINEDFGVTIVLSEHRLDDCITLADRIILLEDGCIAYDGMPHQVIKEIYKRKNPKHMLFIPQIPKLSLLIDENVPCAFTPKQFKQNFLKGDICKQKIEYKNDLAINNEKNEKSVKIKEVYYHYDGEYVLKNLSLEIFKNEFLCIMGANGSGKSTLLKIIADIFIQSSGFVKKNAQSVGYIPQNLNAYFCTDTVFDEINESIKTGKQQEEYAQEIIKKLDITPLYEYHPYDLSGGQQQKVVLASVLLRKPNIIIMDEPTKGIDAGAKIIMAELLKKSDATIIMASHDIEFAAVNCDRCAMLFDGQISFCSSAREFFSENRYYTTAVNRAVRHICKDAIFIKDVLELCKIEKPSFLLD